MTIMVAQWSVGVMARRLLCEWGPPRGALVRQADGLPHGRARRPVRWVQKKRPSGPPPTLGCLGPLCVAGTAGRDPLPPRIPSWVIRLSDSGGLETNLEFAPRPPRAIGSESSGFLGSQSGPAGCKGVPAAHHSSLWREGGALRMGSGRLFECRENHCSA